MTSVIIVNYNSAGLSKKAVESVLGEGENIEIIILDNTATRAEQAELGTLQYPNVRLIFNETNEGFARACNKAYTLSRGEWIFLLNPDAYILPGALKKLKDFLIKNPRAGAAGPKIYWDDDKTFLLPPNIFPSPARELSVQLGRLSEKFGLLDSMLCRWRSLKVWKAQSPVKQKALSGGHVMLRRSAVEAAGGLFDESFFMYYEDSDLMYRLRGKGYSLYVEPEAKIIHNYTHNTGKMELLAESRAIYFNKHFRNNLVFRLADKLSQLKNKPAQNEFINMGRVKKAISLHIPATVTKGWLFEWSPAPSFIPAAGCFGKGTVMEFQENIWKLLGPGLYFGRVSNPAPIAPRFIKWSWEII